ARPDPLSRDSTRSPHPTPPPDGISHALLNSTAPRLLTVKHMLNHSPAPACSREARALRRDFPPPKILRDRVRPRLAIDAARFFQVKGGEVEQANTRRDRRRPRLDGPAPPRKGGGRAG